MIKALVFGKFMPFHKGHEAMIRFALSRADFLSVLVCCSDQEEIAGTLRKQWICHTFAGTEGLEVEVLDYQESEFPNTSVSSRAVSKVWAQLFKEHYPDHNLLITSEPYGEFVADFMGIEHLAFDSKRSTVPISASLIRQFPIANWDFIPAAVRPFYALKVAILGTESTGKTMLSEKLADFYHCGLVLEIGRELIPDSREFNFEDLHLVAEAHATKITEQSAGNHPLIILDTDIHITESYARFVFQKELSVSEAIRNVNQASLYLYLNNDVPYVQDGTRLSLEERNLLDQSHRQILAERNIDFVEISGNWEERFQQAKLQIDRFLYPIEEL
jgi:HTH-type transcriptional repressor of NAD biosynthesis genes